MSLREMRKRIDAIDERILTLLNRRAAEALRIGVEKRGKGMAVRDARREAEVLRRVVKLNAGPLDGGAVEAIYRQVIARCVDLEREQS